MIGRIETPLLEDHRCEVEARVAAASSLVFYLDLDGTLVQLTSRPNRLG